VNVLLHKAFNSYLDRLIRTEIQMFHRFWPAFQVCGLTGLMLAILLTMTLVTYRGLSPWIMAGITLAAVGASLALAMATKIVTGEEKLIYYHHEIAVMVAVALLLWLVQQPLLPYLDITILGVGTFLVCGRLGCLMVGCCHGRPHRWGVCYRNEHAAAGFTPYFVGVRLFPIQAVESVWVLGTVLVGSVFVLNNYPPGEALAWYVIAYDIGRFGFEFLRGDPARPYHWGFSEAQWTSLFLIWLVVGAELMGGLTFHPWHAGAAAGMILIMITVVFNRRLRRTATHRLLHPRHVREVAEAIELVSDLASERTMLNWAMIDIGRTSLGIQISAGRISGAAGAIDHYALSAQNGSLTEEAAKSLANLIIQLKHPANTTELLTGSRGVFHLLIHPFAR
jgi:hypothetical protein